MANDKKNIEVTQSISDLFTPIISGMATMGIGTAYSATAIDHDDHKIAYGCGSTPEEAEQDALNKIESGDSDDFEE